MYRSLLLILWFGLITAPGAYAGGNRGSCRELLQNESDLDKVFELSKLVFVAQISPRPGINKQIYNYRVFPPELKGKVPEQGFITYEDGCKPLAQDAIYVFFLVSLKEKIQGFNSIFMSLPNGGPGYGWIAEWLEGKTIENKKSGDRSRNSE